MAQFTDFVVMSGVRNRKKKSNRGRKKNTYFVLRFTNYGRESFVSMDVPDAARLAGVSEKTVYHWIAGTKTPSPQVQQLLKMKLAGLLPWQGWDGWRIEVETGRLMAPNGYSFYPGELAGWSIQKQLLNEFRRENALLQVEVKQLRQQVAEQAANNLIPFRRKKAGH